MSSISEMADQELIARTIQRRAKTGPARSQLAACLALWLKKGLSGSDIQYVLQTELRTLDVAKSASASSPDCKDKARVDPEFVAAVTSHDDRTYQSVPVHVWADNGFVWIDVQSPDGSHVTRSFVFTIGKRGLELGEWVDEGGAPETRDPVRRRWHLDVEPDDRPTRATKARKRRGSN